jgi:uncharacterized RDD family membrane protein YckC
MYELEPSSYRRYPRVPMNRRAGAFAIDFVAVWLVSSFFGFGSILQGIIFFIAWFAMRVILVEQNQGQSLGRWAMDIKVIAPQFNKVPELVTLSKREAIVSLAAILAMYGLQINFKNGLSMLLLFTPLLVDCALAIVDEELDRAFHDRIAETLIVQTKRGFSLDLRLKKIFGQIRRSMRK